MRTRTNMNDLLEDSSLKPLDKMITNALYGFNHLDKAPVLESNKDHQGHTFFVRPQLNLSTLNIRNIRQMYPLLTKKKLSAQRYVRTMLDPRLQHGLDEDIYYKEEITTPLVDKFNAFIPILSNTLSNISGWPDVTVPTFTSQAGLRKEQFSMIDGTYEIFDAFDLDLTFKNFMNEPLTMLFQTWVQYSSLVFEGMLYPYLDMVVANEIDYNTRVYRFVMDRTGRFVKKVAATGASFPASVPTGKFFDMSKDTLYGSQTSEINIQLKCMGAMYNDDILFKEFNETTAIFNPAVRTYLEATDKESTDMEVIPYELLPLLNYRGYPIVNLKTYELQWLINKNSRTYRRITALLDGDKETAIAEINREQQIITSLEEAANAAGSNTL